MKYWPADVEEVRGVHGGGLDLNEYLAGTRCGCLEFDKLHDVGGCADRGDLELTHGLPSRYVGISPV